MHIAVASVTNVGHIFEEVGNRASCNNFQLGILALQFTYPKGSPLPIDASLINAACSDQYACTDQPPVRGSLESMTFNDICGEINDLLAHSGQASYEVVFQPGTAEHETRRVLFWQKVTRVLHLPPTRCWRYIPMENSFFDFSSSLGLSFFLANDSEGKGLFIYFDVDVD